MSAANNASADKATVHFDVEDVADVQYVEVQTPKTDAENGPGVFESMTVNAMLYTSVGITLMLPMQFGWSISQLNLSTFHNEDDCNARPVKEGTCLMFPGHTAGDWTWVVNLWTLGGMLGSLTCGRFADWLGRKKAMAITAVIMIIGSAIQAAAGSVGIFALGRFVSGIASGSATAIPNGYINEISPPHLRNKLGVSYQCSVGFGLVLVGSTFFFANTASGWRYIAGFPIVLASIFLLLSPFVMVESPTWLLAQGRREDAESEIARLFGQDNVKLALTFMEGTESTDSEAVAEEGRATDADAAVASADSPMKALFSPEYRLQTIVALVLAFSQQLSGINAVFFYSSDMFNQGRS
ncbi:hypothetical protein PINS_up011786 [Pythium insidiosum]|nr:hypothetical protein PINS_up011786 [Pythium insidiosum]